MTSESPGSLNRSLFTSLVTSSLLCRARLVKTGPARPKTFLVPAPGASASAELIINLEMSAPPTPATASPLMTVNPCVRTTSSTADMFRAFRAVEYGAVADVKKVVCRVARVKVRKVAIAGAGELSLFVVKYALGWLGASTKPLMK